MWATREGRLSVHARAQLGVFTLQQALDSGFSRPTVRRRIASKEWHELAPRVYRVALAGRADWQTQTMADVLSTGGVACRRSALAFYGLWNPPPEPEVLVGRHVRTATRLPQRSTDSLPACDVTTVEGVPVTTPIRTLIDVGGQLPLGRFEDVLDTAIVQRLVRVEPLAARARELWAPRRNGCAIVLALLEQRHPDLRDARNIWEARVLRLARAAGLPDPRVNYCVQVGGRRRYIDLAWPDVKVAVEFDGFVPHSKRQVFDDDRVRQNDLVDNDWAVFRITKTMLDADPSATFAPVVRAVASKGSDALQG